MINCDNLVHPFQNDPGVSQRQRVMNDLLSGSAKIDGRTMADLLDYFVQLSRHINYYNANLSIGDWQPFFRKSTPFSLAAMIKYNRNTVSEKVATYNRLFDRRPSKAGLQLLLHYLFQQVINRINAWHLQLKGSGLPAELIIEKLIRDKLRVPLTKFIRYNNVAVRWHCVKPLSFLKLSENDVWGLTVRTLNPDTDKNKPQGKTRRQRLTALRDQVNDLFPFFLDAIRIIAGTAEQCMEQSFFPLKEELQKQHPPHLALLFAFLKLFQHLQGDLNKYTKKHLDFFYKQVLQLKPREAVPDKLHIVFEIQKQLNKYRLKKGLLAKDGKDNNKAEVLFALDDEIVINKTQVADKRTLFLNNQNISELTYVEGVYIAPDAGKADGVEKDFNDDGPKSFPTLGDRLSKYTDPEKTFAQPYPSARIGFILASPVLLLNEGTRTIDITLACRLRDDYCDEIGGTEPPVATNCCSEDTPGVPTVAQPVDKKYPDFIFASEFYNDVEAALRETYYYVSEDLVTEAAKKGISKDLENGLRREFLTRTSKICYCESEVKQYDALIKKDEWDLFYSSRTSTEQLILDELFKPRKAFRVLFSGENEWIEPKFDPSQPSIITISPALLAGNTFLLKISVVLEPDQPAITFYDKEKLKEDFNTTLPLAKVELDDKVKLIFTNTGLEDKTGSQNNDDCCLLKEPSGADHFISLYHFFRNVLVIDQAGNEETRIDVSVCGLKNFIVQNDESVQDVNAPIYPFGTRPKIIDFDIVNPADPPLTNPNLIGPNFYIGSKEVFCKKWNAARINLNWKDKPSNFREYYKAYVVEDPTATPQVFGLDQDKFKIMISILQNGNWEEELTDRKLFDISLPTPIPPLPPDIPPPCTPDGTYSQGILLEATKFPGQVNQPFTITNENNKPFKVDTKSGFIKINLRDQDFLHKDYAFVLSRQMMALGKYPDQLLEEAVYLKNGSTVIVFRNFGNLIRDLESSITDVDTQTGEALTAAQNLYNLFAVHGGYNPGPVPVPPDPLPAILPLTSSISDPERGDLFRRAYTAFSEAMQAGSSADNVVTKYEFLRLIYILLDPTGTKVLEPLEILIPNEPWTPIIKDISIDYTATALMADIDLIHLYPYKDTYKHEELGLQPTLVPVFCDEGTLFIGLKDLEPASNVNILFQLAEATADSESDREEIAWHYLDNNQWKELRNGFEVLDDATDGLTTSGIVKFALPGNMTKENTILPKQLHWIKATIPKNSKAVSETIGIYTQAIRATFTNDTANDKLRLDKPVVAGAVAKLNEADANVKKLVQPHDSFGGRVPEAEGHFYVRVSELLRHKGRAIQKFDYERLALEAFPQLFKAKCINHSFALNAHTYFNDFPVAPGYVLLAVIPDLNQLKAAQSFEPRVPVSMLDDIQEYFKKRTSPFVRFRAMNPRYEKIQFCIQVKLYPGKDENYYQEKMKQDLRELLAPWAIGQYDKLTFGQCVSRSEIIEFLESRDYIDYIIDLKMKHEFPNSTEELLKVCPKTPRSILIAGDIDVCIPGNECEQWQTCLDVQGMEIDCCDNKKIPIADYCPEIIVG